MVITIKDIGDSLRRANNGDRASDLLLDLRLLLLTKDQ
jgi:hypothetical protein